MAGSYQEFEQFVRIFQPKLLKFFMRRGCSASEAQDIAQETWIRVHKGWDGFRGEAPREGWVSQIALHVLRNTRRDAAALKRPKIVKDVDSLVVENKMPGTLIERKDPLEVTLAREKNARLLAASRQLPRKPRQCLELRCLGYSYAEISAKLDLSQQSVKTYIYQAKLQLKSILGEDGEMPDEDLEP